jgi:hypothetical protein
MSKYCKFPWSVNFISLKRDQWKFCCKVQYNTHEENVNLIKEVKNAFLADQQHPACKSCWSEEDKTGISFRTTEDLARTTLEELKTNPPIEILDLEFGNVCNMYCVTCNPVVSSTWAALTDYKSPDTSDKFDQTWPKVANVITANHDSITHINLHGGEPSMDPIFSKLAENLVDIGYKKKIRIITNGNYSDSLKTKFEQNINKLLNSGIKVSLVFSLDAAGPDGEWLRGGLNISRWSSNLLYMISLGINIEINISLSILNLENHIDVLHLLDSHQILNKVSLNINLVDLPHYFSIVNLGTATKDFLPQNWPENMTPAWARYHKRFHDTIKTQMITNTPPSVLHLSSLIKRLEYHTKVSGVAPTPYYNDLIVRLKNIIDETKV